MKFLHGHYYHVYNQGNNKCKIFYSKANYYFFIAKIKHHILPYADVLAYCLMPNHFHLMIHVKEDVDVFMLNHNLGVMLRSYTRAINIQQGRSGSLFRQGTKSKVLFFWDSLDCTEENCILTCFEYIHNNPVKAGFVFKPEDWHYSSAKIYKYKMFVAWVNTKMASELELI